MAYATTADLRAYLGDVGSDAATEALLTDLLNRATALVDRALGFSFGAYAESTKRVGASYSPYLHLPPHEAGSVTVVVDKDGVTVASADYIVTDSGALYYYKPGSLPGAWWSGPYTVTARWGYGEPPVDIVQATLEAAAELYHARDGRPVESVDLGEGPKLKFGRATWREKVDAVRRAYTPLVV